MLSKTAYCRPTNARFFEISMRRLVGRLPAEAKAVSDVTVLEGRTIFGKSSTRVANPAAGGQAAT
jgi:hypothetical protein